MQQLLKYKYKYVVRIKYKLVNKFKRGSYSSNYFKKLQIK